MNQPLPSHSRSSVSPRVDAQELILCDDPSYVCETYIFEPSAGEEKLGYLFAAAEVEDRGGVGRELIEVVMAAIQNEYFRDRERSPIHSFELALHQANLILHDAADRGVRDWMGYFHVAIGALAGKQLHVSVAGGGNVWLARKVMISCVSEGLSHLPITNPLRTFSQVASGDVTVRDTILFATGNFPELFHPDDVARFTIDHSADTVTTRLQQLYRDHQQKLPVAIVTSSLLPDYVMQPREEAAASFRPRTSTTVTADQLRPRKPLTIHRPGWQRTFSMAGQGLSLFGRWLKQSIWPNLQRGTVAISRQVGKGGSKLLNVAGRGGSQLAAAAGQSVRSAVSQPQNLPNTVRESSQRYFSGGIKSVTSWPARSMEWLRTLPTSSKIFGVAAALLLVVLLISLQLLQHKRASDQEIQQAAEILHDAQTKKDAAVTALIYDNRDQATTLLAQAAEAAQKVEATGFYTNELSQLKTDIQTQQDRLQKITRADVAGAKVIGDFADTLKGATPTNLFFTADNFYTFNPTTNAILAMTQAGVATVVSEQTKEIGFFRDGVAQAADKTLILTTSDPGVAIFDTKDNSLRRQEITLTANATTVGPIAVFGNRLYVVDSAIKNILQFNKTLRGYAGGNPWITDPAVAAQEIRSFAVDGNIYTLASNGIRKLFKGGAAEFTLDTVEPAISSATRIYTNEDVQNLYVLDPANKRVVIFTKKGGLVRQVFFAEDSKLTDLSVDAKETTLYVLDGTKVAAVPLVEPSPKP